MSDQKPVNISALAGQLALSLGTINSILRNYVHQYTAHPVESIEYSTLTLLAALEKKLNTRELEEELTRRGTGAQEVEEVASQARNAINSLQEFHLLINRLKRISDDIAKKPSAQDRGVFRIQWDDCCLELQKNTYPISQTLDSLREMAETWCPVALSSAGQAGEGETDTGADTRTGDKPDSEKKAG